VRSTPGQNHGRPRSPAASDKSAGGQSPRGERSPHPAPGSRQQSSLFCSTLTVYAGVG
jgi:hypothetical protein